MKRITLMLLATFFAVAGYSQKPLAKAETFANTTNELRQTQIQARDVSRSSTASRQKSPRKSLGLVTPPTDATPETYYTASGKLLVKTSSDWVVSKNDSIQVIVDGTDIYIAGLAYKVKGAWIKGTISGTTATFPAAQQVYESEHSPMWISGSDDGQTICDVVFNFDQEAGVLECTTTYIGECKVEYAYSIDAYWNKPTFTKEKPVPELVVLPEGVEPKDYVYVMTYDGGSIPVNVAVDDGDVYFQGMCKYLPEAWVKGTKDGNTVTFAAMQYMGEHASYGSSYFFCNGETVFTYDAEADSYSAEGLVYGLIGDLSYKYTNPVVKYVVGKAAMPANPEITNLHETEYNGFVVDFNIPIVDVNNKPLMTSKLSYIIYADTEGTIAPLTFTHATHYLTEDMTEIPYGFTDNYYFYSNSLYLKGLYSADWNDIGIQSIYRSGGEENATEIQWFHIKDYTNTTFNFNKMDLAVLTNGTNEVDINEEITITEGDVTLAVSPKDGSSTENCFWSTSIGPQLRVYSGTLTFTANGEEPITKIVFNHNGNWGANTVEGEVIPNNTEANVAKWFGEAQTVVVNIAANSQINSINVIVGDILVELPFGVEAEDWALEGFYSDGENGNDVFRATQVVFDGTHIYVKGLANWFEDSWLRGTIDAETGIATFPNGQLVGEDYYGKEYMVGFNGIESCDIQYAYDADAKTLTQVTPFILESESKSGLDEEGEIAFWGRWEVSYLHAGMPTTLEAVEVPEGLVTEAYTLNANEWVESEAQPYSRQLQVGFNGNDVYFKGFSEDTADMWAKGTLSTDGKSVTIPANQYMGQKDFYGIYTYNYFFSASREDNKTLEDVVLNYDAETSTFTTDQTVMLNGSMFTTYPHQTFTDVTITKMLEFAATPADPSIDGYKFEGTDYPYIEFNIPAKDTEGNDVITSKLFYSVWVEIDGVEEPFTVFAIHYRDVTENWTEIPYEWDDEYDIYKGGSRFYFKPGPMVAIMTKIGIQSIYYGGGERNTSNIVWMDNPVYDGIIYDDYGLSVAGQYVGRTNACDILFDGGTFIYNPDTNTLTINGSYTGGYQHMIDYDGPDNLTIYVAKDAELNGGNPDSFFRLKEGLTTITGPGKLTLGGNIAVLDGSRLSIKDANIEIKQTGNYAIRGNEGGERLYISNSNIHAESSYRAIANFDGGIAIYDCMLEDGLRISDDGGYICKTDGSNANIVNIYNQDYITGLKDFKDSKDSKDLIFNLSGQRLSKPMKGINIIDGKKIVVR